jgi:hypothetical protein
MTVKYIPAVTCAKCGPHAKVDVQRVYEPSPSGGRRFIRAKCHGESVELPFADDPGAEVKAFEAKE